jgi:hypothetical protein
MKKLIAALVLSLAAGLAGAADLFKAEFNDGAAKVVLESGECRIESLKAAVAERFPARLEDLRGGRATVDGESRELCWLDNGFVFVLEDEKGEGGVASKELFTPVQNF